MNRFLDVMQFCNSVEVCVFPNLPDFFEFCWISDTLFLFDLSSGNGTYLNMTRVLSNVFLQVFVGDSLRFGQSSRLYIVNGPESIAFSFHNH